MTEDLKYREIFYAGKTHGLKLLLCELGKRMWQRGYVDGNGGNISLRLEDDCVLCTPTCISKGFMQPEDLCLVDLEGRRLAGERKCTSEIRTHLAVMRHNPSARACVHAHPPYTTSYALCGQLPPAGVMAEAEIFLGDIGLAPYATPGSPELEATLARLAPGRQAVVLQGHGAVTWGKNAEEAYWRMENLEAFCQMTHLAACRGGKPSVFTERERQELKNLQNKFQ